MVEANVITGTQSYCENCCDDLSMHDSNEDDASCAYCEQTFRGEDTIICEPYVGEESDGENKHYHKPCYEKYIKDLVEIGEAMEKASIPPIPNGTSEPKAGVSE